MAYFLPSRDNALLAWATGASTKLTATPVAFGVTSTYATQFASVVTGFSTAMAANAPGSRSKQSVLTKNAQKRLLIVAAGNLSKLVQSNPSVTNAQKADLGLNVRASRQPIPPPSTSPVIEIESVDGNIVTVKLHGVGTVRRGRPSGVDGATILTFTGDAPPSSPGDFKLEGNVSKSKTAIVFPTSAEPFSRVWISAFWFNPTKESGPAATPISTNLGTWLVQGEGSGSMLKAA